MEKLVYVDDSLPGITRKGAGTGFAYYDPKGVLIRDGAEKRRLNAVALPPAYMDAWFCPAPNGHILATGVDDKGRKQYRYHPDFRAMREGEKFDRCLAFGELLPLVRKRVHEDMEAEGLLRERVIAGVIRVLDTGLIRVGNAGYARRNKSFGATTLLRRHAELEGEHLHLHFNGKSGREQDIELDDPDLARIVSEMHDLPGQELFQYLDGDGERHRVDSQDVNAYLRETMGEDFTAKHFRTFHASALGYGLLANADEPPTIKALLETVSSQLGNTPAVTRSSYVHPAVIELAREGGRPERLPRRTQWLAREERGLIAFLQDAPPAAELLGDDEED